MAKYANTNLPRETVLKTSDQPGLTHEGAPGYVKDARTGLFTMAVTSLTAENSFYESAATRDGRMSAYVRQLTEEDPEFVAKLVPWLRETANMRSAPLVIAAEYALAGGPNKRQVIDSALRRPDEPAEFVGYWLARTGKKTMPGGVQRGVADAVQRLYTEYGVLKYDSSRNSIRAADVIELTHPKATGDHQGDLYTWLLDKRHHGDVRVGTARLPMIRARNQLLAIPEERRRDMLRNGAWVDYASAAGLTWEFLSGWLPGGMDAEAWEAAIPQMGYMALLRNLRNFDEAGVSDSVKLRVAQIISDPDRVAKSKQFPFRFWSAYDATKSVYWAPYLERALELSVQNIPEFEGSTLVLVDVSASMSWSAYSKRGSVRPCDVAALFGAAVFTKNPKSTRVAVFGSRSAEVTPGTRGSILRHMETFRKNHGVDHGTAIASAVRSQYKGEDRVVIFTDMQTADGAARDSAGDSFIHYFDLAGYDVSPDKIGEDGVFMYGGFTDATFRQMPLYEMSRRVDWDTVLS